MDRLDDCWDDFFVMLNGETIVFIGFSCSMEYRSLIKNQNPKNLRSKADIGGGEW
jgi:hypothetical protein